jgi:transposase
MARHRFHSVAFKRQVAEEFIAGETLHGLSKRHDISPQLIRVWVEKFEAGAFDDDVQAANLIQEYEAKIAALERMMGRQALEIELLIPFSSARSRVAEMDIDTFPPQSSLTICRNYIWRESTERPTTLAWISAAPSRMFRIRAPHGTRLISYSRA